MWLLRRHVWLAVFLVAGLNVAIWSWINVPSGHGAYTGKINGFSFSPYQKDEDPQAGRNPSPEEIAKDLATVAQVAHSVRTYTTLDPISAVAPLAAKENLDVTLGAWVSPDPDRNERELTALVRIAHENSNVKRVIVGNESLLRTDVTPEQLIGFINRVKEQISVPVPVSTAEPWHVWLANPALADAVDYITVHVLPYWEGVPIDGAVDYVFMRLDELQKRYPNKHIVLGETGWPSEGQWQRGAEPSHINQERFMRDFLTRAADKGVDYFIVEAFDQPWKRQIEGTVGAYWGYFDKDRQPKLQLHGLVNERGNWQGGALAATLLALFPILWFARRQSRLPFRGILFYSAMLQMVASLVVWTVMGALDAGDAEKMGWVWGAAMLSQFMLLAVLLADGFEFTEMAFGREFHRLFGPAPDDGRAEWPMVSIHVPCYNEPPEMVAETLDHLFALDYPNFEVLLLDNNTKDPNVWLPVEAHCHALNQKLGFERFRFFHLDNWPGYKAGALNYGLKVTDPRATVIAAIDSDYDVTPDWLRRTVPYFDNPKMAIVQAPQDYRDWRDNTFQAMCNWEYAGFFYIGMIHRNERNAIIQHGTMTQVRKQYLEEADGWAEWCITEDAELGLRMFEKGYEAAYLPHSFGKGLIPDGFSAYKTQRFRWAYGAIQIMKRHWRALLPPALARLGKNGYQGGSRLNTAQRFHFIAGWLPWIADAALLCFTAASILWSALLCFHLVEFPPSVFLIPTLCAFLFKVTSGLVLYGIRVKANWGQRIGAAIAGMALTHTVGRAVIQGFATKGKPFVRTPKLADKPAILQGILMAGEELGLLAGLLLGATSVLLIYTAQNREALLWSSMLYIQTLPYWAAVITAMVNAVPALRKLPFFIGPDRLVDRLVDSVPLS